MQASREFIDPRTDPPRFVAVEVPRGAGFTIQSGPWGGPLDDERRALEDPVEAIKAHIAAVGELLDVGFVELGPWLVVTHDPERVRVRPPMTRFFETRRGDEVRREDCGTVKGALAAFEAWLGQRPDDRLEAPPWGEVDVDTGLYGEHAEHFEDDPAAVQRRYYQRKAAPHDEFGPELWLFPSGATRQAVTQLLTEAQGVVAEWYESGRLRGLLSHHNGELRGPALTLHEEDGTIEGRHIYDADGGRRGVLIYEGGELLVEAPEGSTASDDRRGLWTTHRANGRHETLYDPPGHARWTKVYRPDSDSLAKLEERLDDERTRTTNYSESGLVSLVYESTPEGIDVTSYHDDGETVASIGRCLPSGEREGEWRLFDAQGEPRAVCHYRADTKCGVWTSRNKDNLITKTYRPDGTRESILWERHDGTREVRKSFDEDDDTQTIEAYRDDGSLGRRLYRIGSSNDWAMATFLADGTTVASTGPIDSEGRYHGVVTELDPAGEKIGESRWEHGELLSSTTGATIEVVTPPTRKKSMKPLFDCLERGAYAPAPKTGYGEFNAAAPDLPETLESHLAWLHCVASEELDALAPANPKGAWRHRSDAGSELRLKHARKRLKQAIVTRADGTRAAEADYVHRPQDATTPVHIDVRIYHPDGAALRRWGTLRGFFPWHAQDRLHVRRMDWWYEAAADGRVLRAQCFAPNLDADYRYEALYDHSSERSKRGFAAIETAAAKAASRAPSRAAFLKICRLVEEAALVDDAQTREELIPRLREAIEAWPPRLRMAPWLWINRLVLGALPVEALHLASALSLTAAMAAHYLNTPNYPLLLRWLADYPTDGPTVEGISMSFSDDVAEALRNATEAEPQARYHPTPGHEGSLDLDEIFHYDDDHLPVLLGSPLLRDVRVLDVSWQPTSRDFDWDYQGILDGRGLTLGDVAQHLSSDRLEVLDLRGQCRSPRSQLSRRSLAKAHKQRLHGLKVLNHGGGHPLGDATLKKLAALAPALEELAIRPGEAGQVLSGYDFDEWEPSEGRDSVYGRLHEHWGIYGNDDIATMRTTDAAWKALAKLPLRRVTLGTTHEDHRFADDVDVAVLKCYEVQLRPLIAAWEAYFDA
ncbi:MAG: hypothetical protein KC486_02375 [Myxococcales bacterium]|nr:hypothetical protein [Myxococcales bacterium]